MSNKEILSSDQIINIREELINKAAFDTAVSITEKLIDHKTVKLTEDNRLYNFYSLVKNYLKDKGFIINLTNGCMINNNFIKHHKCIDTYSKKHYLACQLMVQMPACNDKNHNINTYDFLRKKIRNYSESK